MSWFLAFAGFALLIILHEFGHFAAAKAAGMRVERFSLFFPPLILKWKPKNGETEYGIGAIPLGGYVKITGMTRPRSCPRRSPTAPTTAQPVVEAHRRHRRRPGVNVAVAFLIFFGSSWPRARSPSTPVSKVGQGRARSPAKGVLQPGDQIVSVDGSGYADQHRASRSRTPPLRRRGRPTAARPRTAAAITVKRDGRTLTFHVKPRYDATQKRMRIGFAYDQVQHVHPLGVGGAAQESVDAMWCVTKRDGLGLGPDLHRPRSASRSPASWAPTRPRGRPSR